MFFRRWLSLVMYMRLLAISLSVIIVSAWIFTNHWVYFDSKFAMKLIPMSLACSRSLLLYCSYCCMKWTNITKSFSMRFVSVVCCLHPLVTGVAICVLMLEFVRLPNLKIATSLLLFLIVYDVFWVSEYVMII